MTAPGKIPPWAKPNEDKLQCTVAQYLDVESRNGDFFWFHVPNGGHRNRIVAAKLKKQGVKAGVWDCLLIGRNHQLYFIELKVDGRQGQKDGGLSGYQVDFKNKLMGLDVPEDHFAVAYSLDDVTAALQRFGLIKQPQVPNKGVVNGNTF